MFREILYVVLRTVGFSVQNLPNAYNYISAFKALILAYEKIQMKALREFIEQVQGGKRLIFNSAEYRIFLREIKTEEVLRILKEKYNPDVENDETLKK